MSPYKIEMFVSGYTKDKMPLYKVRVYNKKGRVILSSKDAPKERAVKNIAAYCSVVSKKKQQRR